MPEAAPYHSDHVLIPPKWPRPSNLIASLPMIAQEAYSDVCDGKSAIGNYQFLKPEEFDIVTTTYTDPLRKQSIDGESLSHDLDQALQIKIANRHLSAQEHVYLGFGFDGERTASQRAALSQLKVSPKLTSTVMDVARTLGFINFAVIRPTVEPGMVSTASALIQRNGKEYIGTASRLLKPEMLGGYALFNAYAASVGVEPATLPDYQTTLFTPKSALTRHIAQFGGPALPSSQDISSGQARTIIARRYRAEFADKLFYPDPEAALATAYHTKNLVWRCRDTPRGVQYTQLLVARRGERGVDTYKLAAHGPNDMAARKAAARIVLDHIGATDLALLQRQ